jgi:hypothetical protein
VTIMILLALAIAAFTLYKFSYRRDENLLEARPSLPTLGIQIICGDCSGDGEIPAKTFMDRAGTCNQCGGTSFVVAATRAIYTFPQLHAKLQESNKASIGQLLIFETPESPEKRVPRVA